MSKCLRGYIYDDASLTQIGSLMAPSVILYGYALFIVKSYSAVLMTGSSYSQSPFTRKIEYTLLLKGIPYNQVNVSAM